MRLTHDFKRTVVEQVERESAFAQALLADAATLFLNGEPETAWLVVREPDIATIGFERPAMFTSRPSKSLHRVP